MFAKKHRLAKTKDVRKTFVRGRSFFYPLFTIKFTANRDLPRFTVVVSTKVSKKAVTRNRIKRVIREQIRLRLSSVLPGDYAIIVKPAAERSETAELAEKVVKGLIFAKLLKA